MVIASTLWAAPKPDPDSTVLNRQQLLERIITVNPTATEDFLAAFHDAALDCYHRRLTLRGARGRESRWVRPEGESAVVWSQVSD